MNRIAKLEPEWLLAHSVIHLLYLVYRSRTRADIWYCAYAL